MRLKNRAVALTRLGDKIFIKRNEHGIPEITAKNLDDLAYGLGWVHANDRQLQVLLTRLVLQGRLAEVMGGNPALIALDRHMRKLNILPDAETEIAKLNPVVKSQMQAYGDGFNLYFQHNRPVFEFRLLRYNPEPWQMRDSLLLGKAVGFLGLADAQLDAEVFLLQLIQTGIEEAKLRDLFPYLKEPIDRELLRRIPIPQPLVPEAVKWLQKLPRFTASNNWVVSGRLTESGLPLLCNDPHLEVNRIPPVWHETVMRLPDNDLIGVSLPGIPGIAIGRNKELAWGATFAFMDMIDLRIEHCRDGQYRRGEEWKPFRIREEVIKVRKGAPIVERFYENDLGVLEGEPNKEGYYLIVSWSAAKGCGANDLNGLIAMATTNNVPDAMSNFRLLDALAFNWVAADSEGAIGYQMSGRMFKRPESVSGLVPTPAWETRYEYDGFVDKFGLPSLCNPADGMIVTANQDLNHLGKAKPINLPMSPYRADRIAELLKARDALSVPYMMKMQYDLYSLQAERFMKQIVPLLPDSTNGRTLREWNCTYDADSTGAMLFESVYAALLRIVFGDHGVGRDVVNFLIQQSVLFADYGGSFDAVLLGRDSAWFEGKTREELLRAAIEGGLRVDPVPYGKTRMIMLSHLLFGGKLPRFFGFDHGPVSLPGSRATITQGQIFRSRGRLTTYSPSYRMVTDLATRVIHTTLAGGSSDRRFSRWYLSDIKNWVRGRYKTLPCLPRLRT